MKTRDKIKYALASVIALATVVGIVGMETAKWRRARQSEDERQRIQQMLNQSPSAGSLPEPMEPPAGTEAASPEPAGR